MSDHGTQRRVSAARQGGVVLMLALIMLVAMTLAGIVLYRQIGTGLIIARNLSFKRTAAVAADLGVESARAWLTPNSATTAVEQVVSGGSGPFYFPQWCNGTTDGVMPAVDADGDGFPDHCGTIPTPSSFDPFSFNWDTGSVLVTADDGAGNEVRWVMHRLCQTVGAINVSGQRCVTVGSSTAGNSNQAADYNFMSLANTSQPFYRVTTRVRGPTNTVVYTQAIIY